MEEKAAQILEKRIEGFFLEDMKGNLKIIRNKKVEK